MIAINADDLPVTSDSEAFSSLGQDVKVPSLVFAVLISRLGAALIVQQSLTLVGQKTIRLLMAALSLILTIINKLSGKALEVEDSFTNPGARIQQTTWNDKPNQRWFIKHTKFCKHTVIPGVIVREAFRNWPHIFRLPQASYSVIADHSGLCLDILNGSAANAEAVQQLPVNGASSQLWAFVPDKKGFNFIVNLYSGQVLDVTNCSLKDYTTVQQYPFNGEDSQRWRLFN